MKYTFCCKITLFYSILFIFLVSSCTKVHKGYKFDDEARENIQLVIKQKLTIQQVIDKFGSPSFINSPINDTMCYVDASGQRVAFYRFYKPVYEFICISFKNNVAHDVKHMVLTEIKSMSMKTYKTSFKKPL